LIHKNHKDKSVFKSFLPGGDGNASNHYQNGGALYGLGLLFTGTGNNEIIQYIIDVTTNPAHNQNEVIMHGACLGLGLAGFATGN
jgi:26S proteasome regulatory subunit N2